MGLHFILGPATADHDRALIDQVAATLRAHPDADVLYLVPNHIKFESEVQVLAALHQQLRPDDHIFAQSRLQVMSFSRLAWYYLNNTAIYQQARLTPAAAGMRIAKIMRDHEDELRVFAGERTHQALRPGWYSNSVNSRWVASPRRTSTPRSQPCRITTATCQSCGT
nr:hypothetical protein [Lacticaseibacillus pantheris]